jgi:two-component system, OmpR family, sensor kinase
VSVRARLLLGLLVVAALGLAVMGAATYRYTRSYAYKQVDQQLDNAKVPAAEIFRLGALFGPGSGRSRMPFGTYGELRTNDGTVVATTFGSNQPNIEPPQLPADLHQGTYTAGSPPYRVSVTAVTIVDQAAATRQPGELVIAAPAGDAVHTLHRLLFVELLTGMLVLLALAGLAWWVVNLGLKPIHEMEETAEKIAAGDLSQRVEVVDDNTEVGRLGVALNKMLEQIETAFDERAQSESRLRRFVADASHELRTPLTSIRGYAELFRRGAADRPEDLAKAMRRIEEEANRMGVLVDDLLLLARLDQGRPLEVQPVDLSRLARDAVDDTRAIAPSRLIDYTPNGAIVVPGDEVRLRQVLGNLMQNALQHTPADTPVHVRVAADGDDAIIEVRDEGQGMSPDESARVFERFWRGDPSRQRASGGAGLGLAIVAAIADAHGGHAEVQSAPGHGATFRVVLPREHQAPPGTEPATPNEVPVAELDTEPSATDV